MYAGHSLFRCWDDRSGRRCSPANCLPGRQIVELTSAPSANRARAPGSSQFRRFARGRTADQRRLASQHPRILVSDALADVRGLVHAVGSILFVEVLHPRLFCGGLELRPAGDSLFLKLGSIDEGFVHAFHAIEPRARDLQSEAQDAASDGATRVTNWSVRSPIGCCPRTQRSLGHRRLGGDPCICPPCLLHRKLLSVWFIANSSQFGLACISCPDLLVLAVLNCGPYSDVLHRSNAGVQ